MEVINEPGNVIDFTFLDAPQPQFFYTILIVLNRPIHKEQFLLFKSKSDLVVCADGAANQIYDTFYKEQGYN